MMNPAPAPSACHPPDDSALIAQSLEGDEKAFRQLVQRYLPLVYNYLYRMTHNADLSEEITQEAFVKAYRSLDKFDPARPFKPWLLRIASNAAISELRKQSKVVSLNALQEDGAWSEAEHQSTEDALSVLERQLSFEGAFQALNSLDVKYRQALLLRYQEDLSYEEIAEAMQVPLNTVRTWLKRGLEKLKTQVMQLNPEGGRNL